MEEQRRFPKEVADKLGWYVYRLIDPRNGETFYVGKGNGDRIFSHERGALSSSDGKDRIDLKMDRIREIKRYGHKIIIVIHRHGIKDENIAYEIEAAVMDCYPGLTNRISGHGSGDYGCRNVLQVISEYAAPALKELPEYTIIVSIPDGSLDGEIDLYDRVRAAWRISKKRASKATLVLAHRYGLVIAAYRPQEWLSATKKNFPWLPGDIEGRFGFRGEETPSAEASMYIGHRIPDRYRRKGAANPVRFTYN